MAEAADEPQFIDLTYVHIEPNNCPLEEPLQLVMDFNVLEGVEITLAPHVELHGRLVDQDGEALSGWTVVFVDARAPSGTGARAPEVHRELHTAPNGSFGFRGQLPARPLALIAVPMGPRDPSMLAEKPVVRVLTPEPGEAMDLGDLVVDDC